MKHSDLRRIGIVGPAGNMALEAELPRHLPPGFAINHARAQRPGGTDLTAESLREMGRNAVAAAGTLVRVAPEIILYACTSGSFVDGPGSEDAVATEIEDLTGVPALTTSRAVLRALAHLGARSVYLVTPYPDAINRAEIAFLEGAGMSVVGCDAHVCDTARPIGAVDSLETRDLVLANLDRARAADAVFLSCTNLLTYDIIPELEHILDRPVVSSNLCSLWGALTAIGAPLAGAGCGRLFAAPAPTTLEGKTR